MLARSGWLRTKRTFSGLSISQRSSPTRTSPRWMPARVAAPSARRSATSRPPCSCGCVRDTPSVPMACSRSPSRFQIRSAGAAAALEQAARQVEAAGYGHVADADQDVAALQAGPGGGAVGVETVDDHVAQRAWLSTPPPHQAGPLLGR